MLALHACRQALLDSDCPFTASSLKAICCCWQSQLKPDQTARMMQCIKRQASDAVDHIKNQLSVAGRSKEEVAKLQAELEELQRTQLGNGLMTRPHEKLQVLFEYLLHWLHKEYRTNGDMAQLLEQIAASIEDL